jgi:hypothetical protein
MAVSKENDMSGATSCVPTTFVLTTSFPKFVQTTFVLITFVPTTIALFITVLVQFLPTQGFQTIWFSAKLVLT